MPELQALQSPRPPLSSGGEFYPQLSLCTFLFSSSSLEQLVTPSLCIANSTGTCQEPWDWPRSSRPWGGGVCPSGPLGTFSASTWSRESVPKWPMSTCHATTAVLTGLLSQLPNTATCWLASQEQTAPRPGHGPRAALMSSRVPPWPAERRLNLGKKPAAN